MDELLPEFLTESAENLQQLDAALLALERAPGDRDLLRDIFRTIHTVKGTCGFLGLERLERVAHSAENVLVLLRDGTLVASPAVIGDVLASVDVIRHILSGLELAGEEPAGDDTAIIDALDRWTDVGAEPETAPVADPFVDPPAPLAVPAVEDRSVGTGSARTADVVESAADVGADTPEARAGGVSDASLRVNVAVLDRLMNMVGELVLTRNQLLQLASADGAAYVAPVQQLNRVTADLQEAVMKTRMQPVSAAWTKLPRLVRDLAASTGKQLDLDMQGATTELDRQVLQAIQDPLTHLVRNAADHGIEAPAARRAAGKSERGQITLNAYHEGGYVVVEVSDDGAGIDAGRVRRKAVERGLVSPETAATMSDVHVLRFVFEPGFSTAAAVTNVSGRGVGMDVVKSNIERIGGTVDLASRPGQGCTVRVRIPLTLAIVPALILRADTHVFAIPQVGVVELVRVADRAESPATATFGSTTHGAPAIGSATAGGYGATDVPSAVIERVGGARLLRLRDSLLPLVRLADVLGSSVDAGASTRTDAELTVVVCQVGGVRFGVAVDEVFDTQDIVVKPVGRLVRHLDVYAGCTILGDGHVVLILDAGGLAERGRVAETASAAAARAGAAIVAGDQQTTNLLVFDAGSGGPLAAPRAVPLAMVSRLEEIPRDRIEFADGRWVVQYRGALLPLVPAAPEHDVLAADPCPVIVFRDGERVMGLAVGAIRDIVETDLRMDRRSNAPGLLGVAVIAGRTTEIIDLQYYLRQARDDWFEAGPDMTGPASATGAAASEHEDPRVLLVDDSNFFLGILSAVVRAAGYHVTTSENGAEAMARLDRGERFDLILSDIDMPFVDGFEFARRLRAAGHDVPLVALTGRGTADDAARADEAGFTAFLTKLDSETLLAAMRTLLAGGTVAHQVALEVAA